MDRHSPTISISKKNKGGILFSVLLLLTLVSFLFTAMLADYQTRQRFNVHTRDHYLCKTMETLTLADLETGEADESGEHVYNTGTVSYVYLFEGRQVRLQTILHNSFQKTTVYDLRKKEEK